jgi:hypothetical protein
MLFVLPNICSKQLHLVEKKYTTNQNQNDQGYAFKDSVLDCVQKITIACIFDSFTVRDLPEF